MNKIIKVFLVALTVATTSSAFAYHHHHHHHRGTGFAIGAGILGAGLLASAVYDATHPRPYVVPAAPVVVTPPPQVVVQQPAPVVVQQPAPVIVQQPAPRYETRMQNVWVEGQYIDQQTPQGTVVRTWQPGHYEQRPTQVLVTP